MKEESLTAAVPALLEDTSPELAGAVAGLWSEAFSEGALGAREKHLMAAAVEATFGRGNGVKKHLGAAFALGARLGDMAEAAMPVLLSHGVAAWECMMREAVGVVESASARADELGVGSKLNTGSANCSGCSAEGGEAGAVAGYYRAHYGKVPGWVEAMEKYSLGFLKAYTRLRARTLRDGVLPRKLKELIIVACHAAHRYERGVAAHVAGAKAAGASDQQVAEAVLVAAVASGIPAWIVFFEQEVSGASLEKWRSSDVGRQ